MASTSRMGRNGLAMDRHQHIGAAATEQQPCVARPPSQMAGISGEVFAVERPLVVEDDERRAPPTSTPIDEKERQVE